MTRSRYVDGNVTKTNSPNNTVSEEESLVNGQYSRSGVLYKKNKFDSFDWWILTDRMNTNHPRKEHL